MPRFSVDILGPLEVRDADRVIALGGRLKRALLAALALNANRAVPLDTLIDALWGERPPPTAATTIQVYVSQLRKELGRERLVTRSSGYMLRLSAEELDRGRFERLVQQARHTSDPGERAALLRDGLALWRGAPLADIAYVEFVRPEADRLEEQRLAALEDRIDAELELGSVRLVAELEHLVAKHPLRERFRAQLMLSLYRADRQVDALALYRDTRTLLVEELGLEPSAALQELQRRILMHDVSLGPQVRSCGTRLRGTRPAAVRAERKIATVLCADVGAPGARDPEDAQALLRSFHEPMSGELARFGSTVNQVVGTALIAIFGVPRSHEDDAERAVRAGIALGGVAASVAAQTAVDARLRIGIDTGGLLVAADPAGLFGGELVSSALSLAGRSAGRVVVGAATHRATADAIDYVGGDDASGWEAAAPRVTIGERWLGRRESPFVGRRSELASLGCALEATRNERTPQIVTLLGPPGIGKTRLAAELRAGAPDMRWLLGRSISYGDGVPYYALRQAVRASLGILESDAADAANAKLAAALADEDGWAAPGLRLLLGLEGAAAGDRWETFAAWRRYLESQAARETTALVLEDVHWADDGLLDFLEYLAEWASGRLFVLTTARPELLERRPDWSAKTLDPLSDDEGARLLQALLPDDVDQATRDSLVQLAGGNPLYAEEYARSLVAGAVPTLLPSVLAVIAARVDGLPAAQKAVLQDAAVVGKVVWPGALAAIGGTDRTTVMAHLERLADKQFLCREANSSIAGETAYVFGHILVRDVAYDQLTRTVRAERHRRAAEWLEAVAGRSEDRAELVAYHYATALELAQAGGDEARELIDRVAVALLRAGNRARRLYANDGAEAYFRRGLEVARARPHVAALEEGLGDVLALAARHDNAVEAYGRAREHVDRDRVARARLHRKAGASRQLQRRVDDALEHFAAGEAALGDEPTRGARRWWHERAEIALARLQLLYFGAPPTELAAQLERDRGFIDAHGDPSQRGLLFHWLAMADMRRLRYVPTEETLAFERAAVGHTKRAGNAKGTAFTQFTLGFSLLWAGRYDEADTEFAAALELARRIGDVTTEIRCLNYMAVTLRKRGAAADAAVVAEQTVALARRSGMLEYVGQATATLAWVAWRHGDLDEAKELAAVAWETMRPGWNMSVFAWMPLCPLLGIAVREARLADAVELGRELLDPARQPMPAVLANAVGRAVAAWDRDDPDGARGSLERAIELGVAAGGYL